MISGNETHNINICEGSEDQLSCPAGSVVNVQQATYGRLSSEICPFDQHAVPEGGCRAANSLSLVRAKCNNKQSCSLDALDSVFGDPCPGISKYLNVVYSCQPEDETHNLNICEGGESQLSCPEGSVVNIQEASFGRLSSEICQKGVYELPKGGCRANNSLSLARAKCNNHQSCSLSAFPSLFGNPCPGTSKYLNVIYSCQPKDETNNLYSCEGSSSRLSCPAGSVVNVQQATYGRLLKNICPIGLHEIPKGGCRAVNSLSLARAHCNNQQSCSLDASSLEYGDFCPGTSKYLNVVYSCQPEDETSNVNMCEGETKTLSCPAGSVVNIQEASYGRLSSEICQGYSYAVPEGGCRAVNSLEIARAKCNNKQSCSLTATYLEYGDPCVGTYKYLNVVYSCQKA